LTAGSTITAGAEACLSPAMLAKTARELLGERPLPRILQSRPVVFVLGPHEAGKSTVAGRLLRGTAFKRCDAECLRQALNKAARTRRWCEETVEVQGLWLDAVDCLHGRYGAIELLGRLLVERAAAGRRTVLCQGPADTSVTLLYPKLAPELGATVLLRFPVGRGRRRYVAERCRARGLDPSQAAPAVALDPWSYARVDAYIEGLLA